MKTETSIPGSAFAGNTTEPVVIPPAPPSDSAWEFRIEPYAWLTGLNGTLGRDPVLIDIDKSFSDIVGNLKMAAALQMEVRNGRWGIWADGFYAALGTSGDAQSPLTGNGKIDLKQFIGELDLEYRIYENTSSFIDLIGGVRYNALKLDMEVDVAGPGPGAGKSTSASAD
ncbi:MAG: hypothetical protein NTV46_01210, partial [Verrucomicrobia bacterium]|nr:hypothetical protein [Verrucomicrobiota bacterium]